MNQKQTGGWRVSPTRSPRRSPSRTKKHSPNSKERSQIQNQSQSQSQNGGRRRKSTMRKLRRGRKSRKVMRGGVSSAKNDKINQPMSSNFNIQSVRKFLTDNGITVPDNLDTATYLEVRQLVNNTFDDTMLNNFKLQFNIDSPKDI
jgi:hypothetical protein